MSLEKVSVDKRGFEWFHSEPLLLFSDQIGLLILCLESQLIEVEGVKTPAGTAVQVRPRRSVSIDTAHRPPAESETPGTEINFSILKIIPEFVFYLEGSSSSSKTVLPVISALTI